MCLKISFVWTSDAASLPGTDDVKTRTLNRPFEPRSSHSSDLLFRCTHFGKCSYICQEQILKTVRHFSHNLRQKRIRNRIRVQIYVDEMFSFYQPLPYFEELRITAPEDWKLEVMPIIETDPRVVWTRRKRQLYHIAQ